MRLGIACLLVGAGCNQIFGIKGVDLRSDATDTLQIDASPYSMVITGMAFNSAKIADPTSVLPTFPVLSNVPVSIGAMADVTSPFPALMTVDVDANGTFLVPFQLTLADYRVVYTPADGVPVEYQTSLHIPHHFIADITIGRPDAETPSPAAVLTQFTPPTHQTYVAARLIETGSWASHFIGAGDSDISVAWSETVPSQGTPVTSQAGPLKSPDTVKGDRLFIVDSASDGTATAYTTFSMEGFNGANPNALQGSAWTTNGPQVAAGYTKPPGFDASDRVFAATRTNTVSDNDNNDGNNKNVPYVWSGVIPSALVPNFVAPGAGGTVSPPNQANGTAGMDLPTFAFMSTKLTAQSLPYVNLFDGVIAPKFPQAIFARTSRSRTTGGVKITEGVQTIALTTNGTTPVDLSIGQPYLGTTHMTFGGVDIWNELDTPWSIDSGAALLLFSFPVDGTVDDCVATLYSVSTAPAYVPVRRYLMPSNAGHGAPPGVLVDRTLLTTNKPYVFGVACHRGYPNASKGDWSTVAYPFSESVLYSFPFAKTTD